MMHGYGEIAKIPVSDMGMVWIQLQMYWIFEKSIFFGYRYGQDSVRILSGYVSGMGEEKKKNLTPGKLPP